jgi:hypothetical protein
MDDLENAQRRSYPASADDPVSNTGNRALHEHRFELDRAIYQWADVACMCRIISPKMNS